MNDKITINEIIKKIAQNSYCLPIIQRGYVWEPKKIELLFDSIMRGYPIGTFLFWELNNKILKTIQFFEFIKYGSENSQTADIKNKINSNINNNLIGVLDGQQRLTSLYIGLCSYYIIKKGGSKKENTENDIKKYLYLDMTSKNEPTEDELLNVKQKIYDFKFLSVEEAEKDKKWFKVSDVTGSKYKINPIKKAYPDKKDIIVENYDKLKRVITTEKVILGITLKNDNLGEVLEIFERTNSFGKSLKKTDLLFSSIVYKWTEGYDKMNDLLKKINDKPNLSGKFDINYIVQSSIVMIGESPKITISSLNQTNIKKIQEDWPNIENSIIKTADLVGRKLNMFSSTIKSINALIPINYFYHEKLIGKSLERYKNNIRRYLQLATIKGIFGRHADTALVDMKNAIDNGNIKNWSLKELYNVTIDGKSNAFVVDEQDIDKLLDDTKGDKSLFTLSILYEGRIHINGEDFEQDHIHPQAPFKKDIAINFPNLSEKERKKLIEKNNKIPNLQLLTKDENESKSDTPLVEYLKNKNKNQKYLIPECSYDVKKFPKFYEKREELLKKILMKKFNVKKNKNQNTKAKNN